MPLISRIFGNGVDRITYIRTLQVFEQYRFGGPGWPGSRGWYRFPQNGQVSMLLSSDNL
jgi:hypothetical protein